MTLQEKLEMFSKGTADLTAFNTSLSTLGETALTQSEVDTYKAALPKSTTTARQIGKDVTNTEINLNPNFSQLKGSEGQSVVGEIVTVYERFAEGSATPYYVALCNFKAVKHGKERLFTNIEGFLSGPEAGKFTPKKGTVVDVSIDVASWVSKRTGKRQEGVQAAYTIKVL